MPIAKPNRITGLAVLRATPTGLEPAGRIPETTISKVSDDLQPDLAALWLHSGGSEEHLSALNDPAFRHIIESWSSLPESLKRAIQAICDTDSTR